MTITAFFEKARELLNHHDGSLEDNVDFFIGDMEDLFLEWQYKDEKESESHEKPT